MELDAPIFVAGHRGLVGSALVRVLRQRGHARLLTRTHAELDLADARATDAFFATQRPHYVFLAAARVGGIAANNTFPAEFIRDNLAIQLSVIDAAWRHGVKRLLFLGSSCIYPKLALQPIGEEQLLAGPLEPTNRPYAVAKIAGIEMCWSYNRQFGMKFLAAMPTNLYGPGDNYDLQTSHVIPALIRKFHEAHIRNGDEVVVWGSGKPLREFLYSDDLADACVHLMNLPEPDFNALLLRQESASTGFEPPLVNIGTGEDCTIRELSQLVREVVGFRGDIRFDTSRPDGTPRKLLDVRRLHDSGWRHRTSLREGLRRTYVAYRESIDA